MSGGPEKTRTSDLRFRKPLLYPAELRDRQTWFAGFFLRETARASIEEFRARRGSGLVGTRLLLRRAFAFGQLRFTSAWARNCVSTCSTRWVAKARPDLRAVGSVVGLEYCAILLRTARSKRSVSPPATLRTSSPPISLMRWSSAAIVSVAASGKPAPMCGAGLASEALAVGSAPSGKWLRHPHRIPIANRIRHSLSHLVMLVFASRSQEQRGCFSLTTPDPAPRPACARL